MTDKRKMKALELARLYLEYYRIVKQNNEDNDIKQSFSLETFSNLSNVKVPKTTLRDLFTKVLPEVDSLLATDIGNILEESKHFKTDVNTIRETTIEQAIKWANKFLELNTRDENNEDPHFGISLRDFAELEETTKSTVEDAFTKYLPLINQELAFKIGSILEIHKHTLVNDKRRNTGQSKELEIEHKYI